MTTRLSAAVAEVIAEQRRIELENAARAVIGDREYFKSPNWSGSLAPHLPLGGTGSPSARDLRVSCSAKGECGHGPRSSGGWWPRSRRPGPWATEDSPT